MFHWLETLKWIPESMHLPLEIFLVVAGVVLAIGAGLLALSLFVSAVKGAKQITFLFWRWCFLAPIKYVDSVWPHVDRFWHQWVKNRAEKKALRKARIAYETSQEGALKERKPVAFLLEEIYLKQWEYVYLRHRKGGETFATWFADQMESLAMTGAMTADSALTNMPFGEKLEGN